MPAVQGHPTFTMCRVLTPISRLGPRRMPNPADRVYTPELLAARMVSLARITPGDSLLVDYACGDGALLRAARAAAPSLSLRGLDLEASAEGCAGFERLHGDFLDKEVRDSTVEQWGRPDVVLLNPPFSRRGRRCVTFTARSGAGVEVPPALAFAAYACEMLAAGGRLVCVLPRSLDRGGWWGTPIDVFRQAGGVVSGRVPATDRFEGVRVAVSVYTVTNDESAGGDSSITPVLARRPKWTEVKLPPGVREIGAGRLRADLVKRDKLDLSRGSREVRYVHTTHLSSGSSPGERLRVPARARIVERRVVALPRVGAISERHIRVVDGPLVLSDCVQYVELVEPTQSDELAAWLRSHLDVLRERMLATGAAYRTRADLADLLWHWWNSRH